MTGSDEEGFQPHPGDPWHPGWSSDAAEGEIEAPPEETAEVDDEAAEELAEQKRRRFGRRRRRAEPEADDVEVAAAAKEEELESERAVPAADVAPTAAAQGDVETDAGSTAEEEGAVEEDEPDPFDAVLEREGLTRRGQPEEGEEDPAPAWTAEGEPEAEPSVRVDQPSWIGQTTEADAAIEATGFEPEVAEELETAEPEVDEVIEEAEADEPIEETVPEPAAEAAAEGSPDLAAALAALASTGEVAADQPGLFDEESEEPEAVDAEPSADDAEPDVDVETRAGADVSAAAEPSLAGVETEAVLEPTEVPVAEPSADNAEPDADVETRAGTDVSAAAEPSLAGEYGVAGPEAFDVLQEPDVVDDSERGEWEAFMGGEELTAPAEPPDSALEVATPEDLDEWEEGPPAKKRRRLSFFRRRKAKGEDVIDDGFVGAAIEPEAEHPTEQSSGDADTLVEPDAVEDHTPFMPPEDGPEETDAELAVQAREPPEAPANADTDAAVVEALEELGDTDEVDAAPPVWAPAEDTDTAPIDSIVADLVAEATGETPAVAEQVETEEVGRADDAATGSVPEDVAAPDEESIVVDLSEPSEDVGPADVLLPATEAEITPARPDDEVEEDRATAEAPDDPAFEDDPGRVPAGWFADVEEGDEEHEQIEAPPELEADEGAWEGRAAWEESAPADVFDVEQPEEVEPESTETAAPATEPSVPEGYEPWDAAVADAVERNEAAAAPAAEPTPPPPPEGFEAFPGPEMEEEFDIAEADLAAELSDAEVWATEPMADMVTEEIDAPYAGDPELEEQVFAAGGTVEHRGLAEAIAEAGEEDTQWQALSAAMPGVETGVVGFEDVADLGGDLGVGDDYVPPAPSNLGVRVATGIILIGLLFGSLLWHEAAFVAFLGLIVMLGLVEFYGTLRRRGFLPLSLFGLLGGVGTLVATWYHGPLAIPTVLLLTSMVTFFFYAFAPTRRDALTDGGLTILGLAWVVGTAAFAIPIARSSDFQVLVLAIVGVTAAMDIGAYSFGRTWGRSPMAPVLSPNKTIEGLAGGVVLAMVAAGAIGYLEWGPFDLKAGIVLGLIVIVVAPLGDLAESLVKRSLGVKDMGSALPGHGGVLDRIDALLFVIPAIWVLYETIGYLG